MPQITFAQLTPQAVLREAAAGAVKDAIERGAEEALTVSAGRTLCLRCLPPDLCCCTSTMPVGGVTTASSAYP